MPRVHLLARVQIKHFALVPQLTPVHVDLVLRLRPWRLCASDKCDECDKCDKCDKCECDAEVLDKACDDESNESNDGCDSLCDNDILVEPRAHFAQEQ